MIAHAIHYNSPRAKKAFVKVSCAALPESLIESELFGYERGAFTGAQGTKKGRFELADGGTLFLDEIGELSPSTQVKLLRVLQEREIERLGGTAPIKVNVRLIAATHRPLENLIEEGTFRTDLYYRLAVFTIFAPPLRERKPDIMLLADHFLERYSREHGKHIRRISTPAIDMLTSYHWPGNVRELGNTIERAVLVCDGGVIHAHHLPPTLQTGETSDTVPRQSLTESVGRVRTRSAAGCAQDDAWQLRARGATARHDRARVQLQGPQVRDRRQAFSRLIRSTPSRQPTEVNRGVGGVARVSRLFCYRFADECGLMARVPCPTLEREADAMVIRRIGVMSAAKITGALYAALGLIAGCILATFSMVSAGFMANASNGDVPSWIAPIFGIGAIVIAPIFYGVMGLIGGAFAAAIYNLVAGVAGGLDLEVQ